MNPNLKSSLSLKDYHPTQLQSGMPQDRSPRRLIDDDQLPRLVAQADDEQATAFGLGYLIGELWPSHQRAGEWHASIKN